MYEGMTGANLLVVNQMVLKTPAIRQQKKLTHLEPAFLKSILLFYFLNNGFKSFRVIHSKVSERLSVEGNAFLT